MIGTKLAHYEITSHLGTGGMGEVFQAIDSKLGRSVAIKLLPEAFTHDHDRAARFEREARVLASLNHPNIAAIYGVEESGGRKFLVMELVPGETLAEHIQRGPLPTDEALPIAKQIADGLEAAHEKGIVHRDLKPANIKITPQGQVKLLDFGLAKAFAGEAESVNLSNSPTLSMAATKAGVILGTAAYMSPEQARGKETDRTTDIWAFGCVLYEILTGRAAFEGETLGEILGSVFKAEPDWNRLPVEAPTAIRRLLGRCLQKDRNFRLRDAADARMEILERQVDVEPAAPKSKWRERLSWIVAVAAVLGLAALAFVHFRQAPPEQRLLQLSVPLPENSTPQYFEISPDGRRLLVVLRRGDKTQIYLRWLHAWEWLPLMDTDNARTPFWSPDSRRIGFFADNQLKVIPAIGGRAQILCSAPGFAAGGTWNRNNVILFASGNGPLRRADPEVAGSMCGIVGKDNPQSSSRLPVFLPDGNHFLYLGGKTAGDVSSGGIYLAALDDPTPHRMLSDYSSVIYSPPIAGRLAHFLFQRDGTLMAQPFDEAKLETVGDPFPVASQASETLTASQVAASVSKNGTLVYEAGRSDESQLTLFDEMGNPLGKVGPLVVQGGIDLSPDGNDVVTRQREPNRTTAMVLYDLNRHLDRGRLVLPQVESGRPVWLDTHRLLVLMTGPEGRGLYSVDLNEGGQTALVEPIAADISFTPSSFSHNFLVFTENDDPKTRADIWYLLFDGKPQMDKKVKFEATDANESQGQLSPNGNWIAYSSGENGALEVHIRPFPTGHGVTIVPCEGSCAEPRWSTDSKYLYYLRTLQLPKSQLLARAVEPDGRGGLRLLPPKTLFEIPTRRYAITTNLFVYSPLRDGHFLVNELVDAGEPTINVITDWQKAVADKGKSEGH